jgi:hypothetical protein
MIICICVIGKRVIISGHSLGGSLALLLALDVIVNHHNDSTKNSGHDNEKNKNNKNNEKNENNENKKKKSKIKPNLKLNKKIMNKEENSMKEFEGEKNQYTVKKTISGLSILLKKYSNILKMIFGNLKIFDYVFSKTKKSMKKPSSMFDNLYVVTFGKYVRKWINVYTFLYVYEHTDLSIHFINISMYMYVYRFMSICISIYDDVYLN